MCGYGSNLGVLPKCALANPGLWIPPLPPQHLWHCYNIAVFNNQLLRRQSSPRCVNNQDTGGI